jgi:hypothetical protein
MGRTSRLTTWKRLVIRWRARRINDPGAWLHYIEFHEIVQGSDWDLARNFDELNERYADHA